MTANRRAAQVRTPDMDTIPAPQRLKAPLVAPATMEAVATGDRAAFDEVYRALSPAVLGLSMRLLRNRAQAEEVTQEIFLEVWRAAATYQPTRGSVQGWVLTICHRRSVDRIRASQAAHDRDLRIGARDYATDSEQDVSAEVETKMETSRVKGAMRHLTEVQRRAIQLTYLDGLTYKEAAANLHVPVGTVKTRLRDGLIRLRDELGVTA